MLYSIETKSLSKSFGDLKAVDDISFMTLSLNLRPLEAAAMIILFQRIVYFAIQQHETIRAHFRKGEMEEIRELGYSLATFDFLAKVYREKLRHPSFRKFSWIIQSLLLNYVDLALLKSGDISDAHRARLKNGTALKAISELSDEELKNAALNSPLKQSCGYYTVIPTKRSEYTRFGGRRRI